MPAWHPIDLGDKLKSRTRELITHCSSIIVAQLLLLSSMLFLAAIPASAQTDLTGVWAADISTGDGNVIKAYLDLHQSGDDVTGAVWYDFNKRPISKGSFADGKLHLEFILWDGTPPPMGIADGTVQDDKIRLVVHLPNDVRGTGIGERTTSQVLEPPARLPLPDLHDVPDNGLARTPPMGWNSWNKFEQKVDDVTVRGMADAMVSSGMRDAGYTYVNIDDTWEGPRDAEGNITGNLKFPNMKGLVDYVHSKGLKIGLYSSPGPNTCDGYAGSYGHEAAGRQDLRRLGIRLSEIRLVQRGTHL